MASRDAKSMKTHKDGDKLAPAPRGSNLRWPRGRAGARNDPNFGKGGGGVSAFTPTARLRKRKTLQKARRVSRADPGAGEDARDGGFVAGHAVPPRGRDSSQGGGPGEPRARQRVHRDLHRAAEPGDGGSFTLRSVVANVPVERTFPTYSPTIKAFEVLERRKVRRGKLYYLRDKPLRYSRV